MKPKMRRYQQDEDYLSIREFLSDMLLRNGREQLSWEVARFDYWRWHGILNMKDGTLEDDVFIWEDDSENIVAVLNREAPGSVFLQIHPEQQSDDLRTEMLTVAEKHLTARCGDSRRALHIWIGRDDVLYQEIAASRGYVLSNRIPAEDQRRRYLTEAISPVKTADGYVIRSLGDEIEHEARCRVSWRAFHPNDPEDEFEGGWYHNVQKAPLYRRDLDLVAVAPSGEFAAFCTIWFEESTGTGLFEPVGTALEHQRRGLGKSILTEGLLRLKQLGADLAYVGSYSKPAHALYQSVGFRTYRILDPWEKTLPAVM
jgi:mycothiol synthase